MTNASAPDPRLSMEERIYRREAIDFQRYRFIGEPLRLGRASLKPSAFALLTILVCLFLLTRANYTPAVEVKVVERHGLRLAVAADRGVAGKAFHDGAEAELIHRGGTLHARIRTVGRVGKAPRSQLRIALDVERSSKLPPPGASATIKLPPRQAIGF